MKLYKVIRNYGERAILDLVYANDEEEVYSFMEWERKDKPPLEISEVIMRPGCVLSYHVR